MIGSDWHPHSPFVLIATTMYKIKLMPIDHTESHHCLGRNSLLTARVVSRDVVATYDVHVSHSHRLLVEGQGAEYGPRMQHVSLQISNESNTTVHGISSAAVMGRAAIAS